MRYVSRLFQLRRVESLDLDAGSKLSLKLEKKVNKLEQSLARCLALIDKTGKNGSVH